ncbi:hypothetical protein IV417_10030 [Alphaproteobacteria bacterium KMM 3653]|uniref:Lipoprotein n=1 Tax=Harenicola maris TaxID=2841044 RepID=A0AAP2CPJ8_9RHOB|nr:hypothetical protein [Harenicola maris]
MHMLTKIAGMVGAGLVIATPALSAACGKRDTVVAGLEEKFSETLTAGGMQSATAVLEVWSSAESGSFTVLLTHANGISCIVSSGTGFFRAPESVKPAGIPS